LTLKVLLFDVSLPSFIAFDAYPFTLLIIGFLFVYFNKQKNILK
jgi:hypothetical protein